MHATAHTILRSTRVISSSSSRFSLAAAAGFPLPSLAFVFSAHLNVKSFMKCVCYFQLFSVLVLALCLSVCPARLSACLSVCVFFCNISITVRQETYLPGGEGGGGAECISVSALRSGFDLTMPFPSSKPCTLPWFVCFSCASTYAPYAPHTAP